MSTSPYSLDLRKKVIEYVKKGNNQAQAAKIFNLHRNTINRWVQKYQKFGNLRPKKRHGLKSKLNLQEIAQFIYEYKNFSLKDIADKFMISSAWASIMIRKLGYRYKKKRIPTWKLVLKNVQNLTKS